MSHIVRFRIDGLLGRKAPIEIQLNRTVNVFFGENGCGKTTLLKILQAAMSRNGEAMQNLPVDRAEVDIFSINQGGIITHTWERRSKKTSNEISARMMSALENADISVYEDDFVIQMRGGNREWKLSGLKRSKPAPSGRWSHSYLPTTRLYSYEIGRRAAEQRSNTEDKLNEAFAEAVNKRWLTYYAQVLKEVKNIQEEGLRAALYQSLSLTPDSQVGPNIDPKQAYERVKKFLSRQSSASIGELGSVKGFAKRYETDVSLRKVVDNINNVEERIELSMAPIHKFSSTINKLFSRGKRIKPSDNGLSVELDGGAIISPALLSSGEKHLLTILLHAMTIGPNAIIIDEPELSMHIDWQHSLAETINALNPECQLIVASHSPEIMANIQDDHIFKI